MSIPPLTRLQGIRLPLRKVNPTGTSTSDTNVPPRSPLSPLTSTSPVYPDGLIAPIWVKKHVEIVPSVFVMFLRLYESPAWEAETRTDTPEAQSRREQERATERESDEGLVREIGERRRRLGERGIKLTVVLMASAAALGERYHLGRSNRQTLPRLTPDYPTSAVHLHYLPKPPCSSSRPSRPTSFPTLCNRCRMHYGILR